MIEVDLGDRPDLSNRFPSPSARVFSSAKVCGWQSSLAQKSSFLVSRDGEHIVIASAAAVASSNRLAPASGKPVRSAIIVWKFSSASRRPCSDLGLVGVYCVYQPGFSSTFRRITGGVTVPVYPMPMHDR